MPLPHLKTWFPGGGRLWRAGYLVAWISVITATVLSGNCHGDDPPLYEARIRAGIVSSAGCANDHRVQGRATLLEMPLHGAAIQISGYGEDERSLAFVSATTDELGQFSACLPVAEVKRVGRIELSMSLALARLGEHADLGWLAQAIGPTCASAPWREDPRCHTIRGSTSLTTSGYSSVARKRTDIPAWVIVFGAGSLICGMYAPVLGTRRLGTLASLGLSLATVIVAIVMLGTIIGGYIDVLWNYQDNGVLIQTSIGYLTQGSFHADIPRDWIFSMTTPEHRVEAEGPVLRGFGAPLWTIVLAMVGACVIALQHLIRSPFDLDEAGARDANATPTEPPTPPTSTTPTEQKKRDLLAGSKADQLLAVVFAPLGAIYVYQTLIGLGITSFVSIAGIMLASGLALNKLVTMASGRVQEAVEQVLGLPGRGTKES